MEDLLTPNEAAEKLNVLYQTILKWMKIGKLKSVKICRRFYIPLEEVDKLIEDMLSDTHRKCNKCDGRKIIEEFPKKGSVCKECKVLERKEYYTNNKEKVLANNKKWKVENRQMVSDGRRKSYENNIEKENDQWRYNTYGIDGDTYRQMLNDSNGKCAICQKHCDKLCIDHDHTTGQVRDLLCNSCNSAVGFVKEDTQTSQRLTQYLQKHQPPQVVSYEPERFVYLD